MTRFAMRSHEFRSLLVEQRWLQSKNSNLPVAVFALNAIVRCSSEELLDRLFKKSVVTEAEVSFPSRLHV